MPALLQATARCLLPRSQDLEVHSRDARAPMLQRGAALAFVAEPKKKAKTSVLLVLPFTIHWEELRSYSLFSRDSSESSCKDVNLYAGDPGVNMAIHDSGLS